MVERESRDEEIGLRRTRLDGAPKHDSFLNKDGLLLRSYGWLVKNAIGIIILLHGIKCHARLNYLRPNVEIISDDNIIVKDENNYYVYEDSWVQYFNQHGYSVFGLDLQGHGLSDGFENLRYNVKEFDDFSYDLLQYISKIQDSFNGCNEDDGGGTLPFLDNSLGERKPLPIY
ncbi:hypothetical protein C922_05768, partial [Plasmodium inui San Antonio 1]